MGYMGLSHWVGSDNASGFRYTLQECFKKNKEKKPLKAAVRKLVMKELKDGGNCYNTSGPVNVALVMEDEGKEFDEGDTTPVFSKFLSKKEFVAILKGLDALIKNCDNKSDWAGGGDNRLWHKGNFKRMRDCVYRKTYKE